MGELSERTKAYKREWARRKYWKDVEKSRATRRTAGRKCYRVGKAKPVYDMTREEIYRMLDAPGGSYEPIGRFIVEEVVDGTTIWTAVDNSHGEALIEEFATRRRAVLWLHGYKAVNRYGDVLNETER